MTSTQRIDGWKAIGRFLGRDARTAQRWAQSLGLPVRHVGGGGHSVYAWAHDLRGWLDGRDDKDAAGATSTNLSRAPGLLVIPFEFHGPAGSDHAFVGEAISAEILHRLAVAPLAKLRVMSRTTARGFASTPRPADRVAADLGIRYLVEGSVIEAGARWVVAVRVVDAPDDRVVLADRFAAEGRSILKLHTTIAEAVAGHLSLNLGGQMLEPFWNDEVDPGAFLAFVRGWTSYSTGVGGADLRRAVDYASEAIALDPNFAPAYALRGLALNFYSYYYGHGDPALSAETRAMGRRAMNAGPQLATSNILDALIATYHEHDWDRAEQRYRFVVNRLPSDAHARRNLAFNLSLREKMPEARSALAVAQDLDRSPRLTMMQGVLHQWCREYEAAVACFGRVLDAMPGDAITNIHSITTLGPLLRDESRVRSRVRAQDAVIKAQWGSYFDACIAVASGDAAALAAARDKVREQARRGVLPWYADATIAGAAGDIDGVVQSLKHAIEIGHGESVAHLRADPVFDSARDDPRFVALLRKLKLLE